MARNQLSIPTVKEQLQRLLLAEPLSGTPFRTSDEFLWRGGVKPSPVNGSYLVQIYYQRGRFPETNVLSPKLKRYEDRPLPHVYPGERLCLFYPKATPPEWTPAMWLSETVLPWTALWLIYYEHWLVNGVWLGDEIDHTKEETSL
ncbi:MAG: hypothetical protein KDN22_16905 [Verrucomicrobiae bacterium]|nr:hypothetical protein [Verrucomicrobiae bacterium]